MPVPYNKLPINQTLPSTIRDLADTHQSLLGKAVPASVVSVEKNNTIVKIKFELQSHWTLPEVTVPVFGPEYTRWPIQVGDKGMVVPSDFYMGGMSGLGDGVATSTARGNLSTLVWMPIGNKKFTDSENQNAHVLYGPDGVILKTTAGDKGKVVVDKEKAQFAFGPCRAVVDEHGFQVFYNDTLKFIVDGAGARFLTAGGVFGINVTDTGTFIDNKNFLPHLHSNVQTGPDPSGPVDPSSP